MLPFVFVLSVVLVPSLLLFSPSSVPLCSDGRVALKSLSVPPLNQHKQVTSRESNCAGNSTRDPKQIVPSELVQARASGSDTMLLLQQAQHRLDLERCSCWEAASMSPGTAANHQRPPIAPATVTRRIFLITIVVQ